MVIPNGCALTNPLQCESSTNPPNSACPASSWYQPPLPKNVTLDDGTNYPNLTSGDIDCTSDSWSNGCTSEYCKRQTDAQAEAGTIMSIPYIISACLSPILGGFVDRFGMRAVIATIAPLMLVIVHLFLGFTSVSPVGPLVGQGLAYSGFAAVLWPSIAMVVDQRLVGLAYGIVVSIQNMGLAAFPLIIAAIYTDNGDKYIPNVEVFFVVLAWIGVIIGLYLNFYDYNYINSILNVPRKPEPKFGSISSNARGSISSNPLNHTAEEQKVRVFAQGDVNRNSSRSADEAGAAGDAGGRKSSSELFATSMIH